MPKAVGARPALDAREPLCGLPIRALVDETSDITLKELRRRWPREASGKVRSAVAVLFTATDYLQKRPSAAPAKWPEIQEAHSRGHWKTTAFVAELHRKGMVAPMVLDGPVNGRLSSLCRAGPHR